MSLRSKWLQFTRWVSQHKKDEFDANSFDGAQPIESWTQGETQATYQTLGPASSQYWKILGLFTAAWWDAQLGTGNKPRPNTGPVTGNTDMDALILTGGLLGIVGVLFYIFKKLF